mmetsp:Transcript_21148/g.59162  ORF Transcript_21148/g.59162 Transcript_21148/m.59162 type:complete len:202 (+) Transcript_21148:574-1179(+)
MADRRASHAPWTQRIMPRPGTGHLCGGWHLWHWNWGSSSLCHTSRRRANGSSTRLHSWARGASPKTRHWHITGRIAHGPTPRSHGRPQVRVSTSPPSTRHMAGWGLRSASTSTASWISTQTVGFGRFSIRSRGSGTQQLGSQGNSRIAWRGSTARTTSSVRIGRPSPLRAGMGPVVPPHMDLVGDCSRMRPNHASAAAKRW